MANSHCCRSSRDPSGRRSSLTRLWPLREVKAEIIRQCLSSSIGVTSRLDQSRTRSVCLRLSLNLFLMVPRIQYRFPSNFMVVVISEDDLQIFFLTYVAIARFFSNYIHMFIFVSEVVHTLLLIFSIRGSTKNYFVLLIFSSKVFAIVD